MLDLKYIKENADAVKKNVADRFMNVDVDLVIELYDKRNSLITQIDDLRQKRNENAKKMKGPMEKDERQKLIDEGKQLKEDIASIESELNSVESNLKSEASKVPNMAHPDAPVGKEDKDNLEIKRSGTVPEFSFKPKDHIELATALDLIDFDTAAKVSGPKFYYLKNEAVILEMALTRYAVDVVMKHGFTPTITPDVAKEEILEGIGFNPRGAESNIYTVQDTGTCLVGTAEITLGGYHSDKIFSKEELPIKMAGISHCFRREAGAAGQYSKGLYRVHQFSKVEMFIFCKPEDADDFHEEIRSIEEEIFSGLDVPFRVVDTCTGDLGAPAYRKYDLEAWMPGRGDSGDWGEITSTSNCTDYQARRLGIRFKDDDGKNKHVYMLNGTAIALSRGLIAIIENFQTEDGSIRIPEKLVPYTGFDIIKSK
ncbi:MAG: serine--tRNA ligase [Spirochaetales bacterium]|nr:serine--tRNA ligase [Spirochaetales bacterium]